MMMRFPLRLAKKALARDDRGATVIEFAMVAPVLALLTMGIVDFSRGFAAKLRLEQAANRSLENAAVRTVQSDYSFLKAEAATAASVPQSAVTVTNWLECNQVKQTSFSGVCPDGQQISRYVQVTIASSFEPSFNYGAVGHRLFNTRPDGTVAISGAAALRVQ